MPPVGATAKIYNLKSGGTKMGTRNAHVVIAVHLTCLIVFSSISAKFYNQKTSKTEQIILAKLVVQFYQCRLICPSSFITQII